MKREDACGGKEWRGNVGRERDVTVFGKHLLPPPKKTPFIPGTLLPSLGFWGEGLKA